MKLTIKTLKGEIFTIEAELPQTVFIYLSRFKMSRKRLKKPKDLLLIHKNQFLKERIPIMLILWKVQELKKPILWLLWLLLKRLKKSLQKRRLNKLLKRLSNQFNQNKNNRRKKLLKNLLQEVEWDQLAIKNIKHLSPN